MQLLGVALAGVALWPPERGVMLLTPVSVSQGVVADIALDAQAAIVGRGPFAGSLLVLGARSRLAGAAWRGGAILTAAPAALCGDPALPKGRS